MNWLCANGWELPFEEYSKVSMSLAGTEMLTENYCYLENPTFYLKIKFFMLVRNSNFVVDFNSFAEMSRIYLSGSQEIICTSVPNTSSSDD